MRSCRCVTSWGTRTGSDSAPDSELRLGTRRTVPRPLGPHVQLEFTLLQLDVREPLEPIAQQEERATAFAALVDMMEVPDHHRVVAFGEPGCGDLAEQPLAIERQLAARVARPARRPQGERDPQVGVEPAIQRETGAITQQPLEELVTQIAADETIAMMQPDTAPLEVEPQRSVHGAHTKLVGQEPPEPEVVVAVHERDF